MSSSFTIQTDVFEGPFSALLELIEKHKLSINEVSLSDITDEYIAYVGSIDSVSMNELSQFIVVAATLMLIKSRTLLPGLSVSEEEESEIETLTNRLEVFQVVKAISGFIRAQYGKALLYRRPFIRIKKKVFSPGASLSATTLCSEAIYALENVPKEVLPPETKVRKAIRIEDVLVNLMARVQKESRMRFSEFAAGGSGSAREVKTFIVVSFLAMLELVKNGTLDASQDDTFGEITINS
jgi:segregation and condensation protein A